MLSRLFSKKAWEARRIYIFIVFCAITLAAVFVVFDRHLRVRTVVVSPLSSYDPHKAYSLNGLSSLYEQHLVFLDIAESAQSLIRQNASLKQVFLEKKYPDTLLVTADYYRPVAYLVVNPGAFVLSSDGRILEKTKTTDYSGLPKIEYYQKLDYYMYQSGDRIDFKEIITSMQFLEEVSNFGYHVGSIDINGLDMIVLNSNKERFMFTTQKDPELQKYQFSTIARKFKSEGKKIEVLDLRFDKPVVEVGK